MSDFCRYVLVARELRTSEKSYSETVRKGVRGNAPSMDLSGIRTIERAQRSLLASRRPTSRAYPRLFGQSLYVQTPPKMGGSPSLSVQHRRSLRLLVSYNPEHLLVEEAPHDVAAQSSRLEAPGCCHKRRDDLALH